MFFVKSENWDGWVICPAGLAQSAALRPTNQTDIGRADHSQKTWLGDRRCGLRVAASVRKMPFVGGHGER